LGFMGIVKEGADEAKKRDFVFATTALAKQMMETTQDAATNAKTVLGYNLPATFADLGDESEAKEMVKQGNFYGIGMKIIDMYESGSFPVPDSSNLLAAFMDGSNNAIVEDTQVGGDENSYPQAYNYKATMKSVAKEMNVKGKNLFHPVRLALTGEMSGQDVTKQLSLLAMASGDDTVVNAEAAGVVPIEARMEMLKSFWNRFLRNSVLPYKQLATTQPTSQMTIRKRARQARRHQELPQLLLLPIPSMGMLAHQSALRYSCRLRQQSVGSSRS
jgi:glutamyl-tRNA synthetase